MTLRETNLFRDTKLWRASWNERRKLKEAMDSSRSARAVTWRDKKIIKPSHRFDLLGVNHYSRMIWCEALCHEIERLVWPQVSKGQAAYLVTIVDVACAVAVEERSPDIKKFKQHLGTALNGFDHISFLEPAYFTNMQSGVRFTDKRCVFWHLHGIVWDVSERILQTSVDKLNASQKYNALYEGPDAVHFRRIKPRSFAVPISYVLKPPGLAYRVSRGDWHDRNGSPVVNADGEVLQRFRQNKSRMRPGERLKLFHATKNLSLDQLALAGGEGRRLLARAKRRIKAASENVSPMK